jgi:predicted DNA-binding transcriptional regulator AlpA
LAELYSAANSLCHESNHRSSVGSNMSKAVQERNKTFQEQNVEYQILKGIESDIAYLMERVTALEAARPPPDRLLNQESAAVLIGVKPPTLAAWRHYGKGPKFIKVGRSAYYKTSDINEWLDAQCVIPVRKGDAA